MCPHAVLRAQQAHEGLHPVTPAGQRSARDTRQAQGRAHCGEPALLRHGGVLLPSRLSDRRGQVGGGDERPTERGRQAEESEGYPDADAGLRPHPADRVPSAPRQW